MRAPICARRSREPSERGEDGKTKEVNVLFSFRGHATDVALSCSRATVQQTSGDWLRTREIQRWRFCTSYSHRNRSPSFLTHPTEKQNQEIRQGSPISDAVSVARAGWSHLKHFAVAYCQSTASVSSATLTVLGCRVESSPSDVGDFSVFGLRYFGCGRAIPCMTIVAVYSMAGRGLTRNAQFLVQNPAKLPGGERLRNATQLVCRLIFKPSAQDVAAFRVWCSQLGCFSKFTLAQTRKRKVHAPR